MRKLTPGGRFCYVISHKVEPDRPWLILPGKWSLGFQPKKGLEANSASKYLLCSVFLAGEILPFFDKEMGFLFFPSLNSINFANFLGFSFIKFSISRKRKKEKISLCVFGAMPKSGKIKMM